VNLYGPTETNVCTWYEVPEPPGDGAPPIPIGRVIAGVRAVAVADDGSPAGPGETGELHVAGPTVMAGYWNDPERTAQVLVPAARTGSGHPSYRTGDIVRVGDDGVFHYLGRRDNQVKSRGHRIELGEIEAAILAHPKVAECALVAVPDDVVTHRLWACVVPDGGLEAADVTRQCRERLPRYMVPDHVELFEELPRTSTGKTDRQALHAVLAGRRTEPSPRTA
jgi:acyl-coenzyme A synthetase/AMP-(fatty) acid ligase